VLGEDFKKSDWLDHSASRLRDVGVEGSNPFTPTNFPKVHSVHIGSNGKLRIAFLQVDGVGIAINCSSRMLRVQLVRDMMRYASERAWRRPAFTINPVSGYVLRQKRRSPSQFCVSRSPYRSVLRSSADTAGMPIASISSSMSIVRLNACRTVPRSARGGGFTLMELMAVVAVVGLLAAIALPGYAAVIERQKVVQAGLDLHEIAMLIERYRTLRFSIPESLDDLGPNLNLPKDPWGRDYQFLNFNSPAPGVNGKIRKDHNLHPLNSEFDLYSLGKDGLSQAPLTARASHDDVIWARDGGFVGLAEDY